LKPNDPTDDGCWIHREVTEQLNTISSVYKETETSFLWTKKLWQNWHQFKISA